MQLSLACFKAADLTAFSAFSAATFSRLALISAFNSSTVLKAGLEGRGMKFEQYLEYVKMDLDAIRNNYREIAAENVKADLMLEAIAKAEDVKVEATDLADEVENMAKAYGATPEQVQSIIQQQGRINDLINTVVRKKAVQIILDNVAQ